MGNMDAEWMTFQWEIQLCHSVNLGIIEPNLTLKVGGFGHITPCPDTFCIEPSSKRSQNVNISQNGGK